MPLLCVAGTKGAGKDTLCDYLVERHGFQKFAFADALKRVSLALIHATWPSTLGHLTLETMYDREAKEKVYPEISFGSKPFSIRWFLQYLGTDIMRTHLDDNLWVSTLCSQLETLLKANPKARICISDCRFENEVQTMIKRFENVSVVRLERESRTASSKDLHPSERQDFEVDLTYPNNGTKEELFSFCEEVLLKGLMG